MKNVKKFLFCFGFVVLSFSMTENTQAGCLSCDDDDHNDWVCVPTGEGGTECKGTGSGASACASPAGQQACLSDASN